VDPVGLAAAAFKGQTQPVAGWYGMLGEYPAWEAVFERKTVLPARMDAVLFPQPAGSTDLPSVQRLRADAQVTAFTICGAGLDDLFILCEEDAGEVAVAGVRFAGRALLLRRGATRQALAVAPRSLVVDGEVKIITGMEGMKGM
jgi:hypothetical protein